MSMFNSFFGHLANYEFTPVSELSPTQGLTFSIGNQSKCKARPRLKSRDWKTQSDATSRNGFPSTFSFLEEIANYRSDVDGLSCGDPLMEKVYAGESPSSLLSPHEFSRECGSRLYSGHGFGDVNLLGKSLEAGCKDSRSSGHQLSEAVEVVGSLDAQQLEYSTPFQTGEEHEPETDHLGMQCLETQPAMVEYGLELSASFQLGEIEAPMCRPATQGRNLQQQPVEFGSPKFASWGSPVDKTGEFKVGSSNQSLLDQLVCPLPDSISSPQGKQSVVQSPSPESSTSPQSRHNAFQKPSPESIMSKLIGIQRNVEKLKAVVPRLCKGGGPCTTMGKREAEAAAEAVTFMSKLANAAASILPAVEPQVGVNDVCQSFNSFESSVSNNNLKPSQAFGLLEQPDKNDNLKHCHDFGSFEQSDRDCLNIADSISSTSPVQFCEIEGTNVEKLKEEFSNAWVDTLTPAAILERASTTSCRAPLSNSGSLIASEIGNGGQSPPRGNPELGSERSSTGLGENSGLDGLAAGVVDILAESFDLGFDSFRESCLGPCQAKTEWAEWNCQLRDTLVEELTTSLGNAYSSFTTGSLPLPLVDSQQTSMSLAAQAAKLDMEEVALAAENFDGSDGSISEDAGDSPNSCSPVTGMDDEVSKDQEPGEVPRSCYTVLEMEIDDEVSREGELDKDVRKSRYKVLEMNDLEILTDPTYFCNICNKGFKREANLKMHMRSHGARYKASTPLIESYKGPKLQQSEDTRQIRFSCPFKGCNRNANHPKFQALKTMLCLKNHYKRSHCAKTLQCRVCKSKQFSVVADLKTHEKHCGSDNWLCSCGTTFSRKEKLRSHIGLFEGHYPVNVAMVLDDAGNGRMKSGRDSISRMQRDRAAYLTTPVGVTS